jgi:hypothetical protein
MRRTLHDQRRIDAVLDAGDTQSGRATIIDIDYVRPARILTALAVSPQSSLSTALGGVEIASRHAGHTYG